MPNSPRQALQYLEQALCNDADALAALSFVAGCLDRMHGAQAGQEPPPNLPPEPRTPAGAAMRPDPVHAEDVDEDLQVATNFAIAGVPHIDAHLHDVLRVTQTEGRFPFDLAIKVRRVPTALSAVLTGPSIYLLQYRSRVVYAGKYQPITGSVVKDRWWRHLQTVTLRGDSVGLGGIGDPEGRLARMLERVDDAQLNALLAETLAVERHRFRDTGVNTSVNRTAFAAMHWSTFAAADPVTILKGFSFHLFKLAGPTEQPEASAVVSEVEKRLLRRVFPRCNDVFDPRAHEHLQDAYTLDFVLQHLTDVSDELRVWFQQTVRLD